MERWYARTLGGQPDCLMGHKVTSLSIALEFELIFFPQQWFLRRKQESDCVIADKFKDPVGREEDCPCDHEDYEWFVDFSFVIRKC